MFIFLVRHAEGSGSREKWQTPNTPLSDTGVKQSENLTILSRFKKIDIILSSKWKRALETAKIVSEILRKPLEQVNGIQEREQYSEIYGADRKNDISKRYNDENIKNYNDLDWKFENNEESIREVSVRAFNFKNSLTTNYLNKSIVVVSHEMFIRCFITNILLGEKYDDKVFNKIYRSLQLMNTGVSLLEFNENRKTWKVWYINDFSHLGRMKTENKQVA
ncbi:MAG: histidine phosphatase family protein [Candidatus Woesebacteria bacterium]|nr:histidine phosphatase family protein [Candidatus Woesebacteria bacterium]